MSKLDYLYIPAPGDKEIVQQHTETLANKSNQELIDSCNRQVEIGIVGSRTQVLYLVALRKTLLEREIYSPIYIKYQIIIGIEH